MYNLQLIKEKINCIDYARMNGIDVEKEGDRTYSPFHRGKNPTSFMCFKDSWYSFSDGYGGDVIDLCAMLHHKGNKGLAIKELAEITHTRADHDTEEWRNYMQELGNRIFYYNTKLTEEDIEYLHSRGITDATISALKLGRNEEGRLVIPYWKNGAIVYFVSRARPDCKFPESKYRKMKIDDFNDHCPWGLDTLSRQSDTLVIAEGAFDAMAFYQEGYPVISAITGHFSSKQLPQVINACRNFKNVVLTYDTDPISKAGEKFTVKMAKILYQNGIPFSIAPMPAGFHDVSEFYANGNDLDLLLKSTVEGMAYLCSTFTDFDELERFAYSIARSTPAAKLATYLSANSHINALAIKELLKAVKNCPNEQTIAMEILQRHTLIYVVNDSFYEWNGRYWERLTDLSVQNYAIEQYGKVFASAQRAQQVTKLLKALIQKDIVFNKKHLMSFRNGTLELSTGNFREHMEADYISMILDYDYDATATCPRWEKFINEITAGVPQKEELLQQIAGYVLFPNCKFQKIFVFIGEGSNGKSVYLDTLEKVYDRRNCTFVDPSNMTNEFWLIHLKDSYLNFATEINNDFSKAENILKMLSDGTAIQACYKGQNHMTFEPRCKLVFACNALPKTKTIAGMERRMHFINFPVKFTDFPDENDPFELEKDVDLMPKLQAELPGIFNWCYSGYLNLLHYNSFTDAPEQDEYLTQFREASNPVEVFVRDLHESFTGVRTRQSVYDDYCLWAEANGHYKMANNNFHVAFRQAMGKKIIKDFQHRVDGKRVRSYEFPLFVEIPVTPEIEWGR